MEGVGIYAPDLAKNASVFGRYCPVALIDKGELIQSHPGIKYSAEYRCKYYNMENQSALQSFLDSPETYTAKSELPSIPRIVPEEELQTAMDNLELKGYCPVTLLDGPKG